MSMSNKPFNKSLPVSKKTYEHIHKKGRSYWFYYHLKHDTDFQSEAAELAKLIIIESEGNPPYLPTDIGDYDYFQDPDKNKKLKLIEDFQLRWKIHWDYFLLNYLIRGNPDDVPPAGNGGVALGLNEERNMFQAQIPITAEKEDMELLWKLMQSWKKDLGIDLSKKPRKHTFTENKTAIAYLMWKLLRDGKSWTYIVKAVKAQYDYHFEDISTAQKFLKANGYFIGGKSSS